MGFLHFENVTSHPVLLTFVRLLLARPSGFEPKWRKMKLSLKASVAQGEVHIAELGEKGSLQMHFTMFTEYTATTLIC